MLTISKASKDAIAQSQRVFGDGKPFAHRFAYNVWSGSEWLGTVLFGDNNFSPSLFDKWSGQAFEISVNLKPSSEDLSEIISAVIAALVQEWPIVDVVISRKDLPMFKYCGFLGDGKKGAFIVNNERLHAKTVRKFGWRASLLWLKEHVSKSADMFDQEANDMYFLPITENMQKRCEVMEVLKNG